MYYPNHISFRTVEYFYLLLQRDLLYSPGNSYTLGGLVGNSAHLLSLLTSECEGYSGGDHSPVVVFSCIVSDGLLFRRNMNIATSTAIRARAARVMATPIPACAALLRPLPLLSVEPAEEFGLANDAPSVLASVGVGLKSALDKRGGSVLVVVRGVWAVDAAVELAAAFDAVDDEPVMVFQSFGATALNVVSVIVPLQPPFPQHIHNCVESSY